MCRHVYYKPKMMNLSAPAWARIAPFALFMLMLALRGFLESVGFFDARWVYGLAVLLVGASLLLNRSQYIELHSDSFPTPRASLLAVGVGLGVFVLWINLDFAWATLGEPAATFRPVDELGALDWRLIAIRLVGAAIIVPLMEELFWRSFLMRWIDKADFERVPPRAVSVKAVLISTTVFALAHTLWLAAIVAGLAYAWIYRFTGSLWTAVLAHAVTNLALGVWVIGTGSWSFW